MCCAGRVRSFWMIRVQFAFIPSEPQQISHSSFNVLRRSTKETCLSPLDQPDDSDNLFFMSHFKKGLDYKSHSTIFKKCPFPKMSV